MRKVSWFEESYAAKVYSGDYVVITDSNDVKLTHLVTGSSENN